MIESEIYNEYKNIIEQHFTTQKDEVRTTINELIKYQKYDHKWK